MTTATGMSIQTRIRTGLHRHMPLSYVVGNLCHYYVEWPMATMTVAEAKNRFSDVLRRAEYGGERVIVERHGKPVAAIVSTDDLRRLEAAEDAADLRDAQGALTEATQEGTVPLETVLRKYGLDHLLAGPAPRASRPRRTGRTRVSVKRSRKTSTDRRRR